MYLPGTDLDGRQAQLGPVRFGVVDYDGVAWVLQELEGWDSAEVRAELRQRQADHGAWPAPVYLGERPVTLAGKILAPDLEQLDAAVEQLLAAAALTDTPLIVFETVPKQATVRRSGKPLVRYVTDQVAEWSVLVTAADPRRYSTVLHSQLAALPSVTGGLTPPLTPPLLVDAVTVEGAITAHNEGTLGTRPVLTITGPVTSPRVLVQYDTGAVQTLAYSQDLAAGEQLVIDTDAHTVMVDGTASRRRWLSTPSGWPEIPPASTVTFLYRAALYNSTTTLTAEWRSAWI